jgi:aspartate/methionine/tyrosine aminotransferase
MKIPDFELERWKANYVIPGITDLTETGIPEPLFLRDIFSEEVLDLRMDYAPIYGNERLRHQISELYSNIDSENVLVTTSTSEGNMIAVNTLINNGDEVVVQLPAFMQIPGLVEAIGTRIRWFYLEEEDGFEIDVDKLNECVTKKTSAIALNYPNNPTGRILDKKKIKGICEIAEDNDAWIITDEVYRGIEFDGPFSPSFAEYYDKAVITSSLSKVWGLAGLRVGWMIGNEEIIKRGSAFKEYTTLGGSILSEYLATQALEEEMRKKLIDRGRRLVGESFKVFDRWMDSHKDIFTWVKPKFGVIALVKHNFDISSSEFTERVFKEKKVAIVPCDIAFTNLEDYLRICYCHSPKPLQKALEKIDEVIDSMKSD